MKNKIYPILIILSGVFWASACIFVDYLSKHTPFTSFHLTAIRMTVAAILLNTLLIVKGKGLSAYRLSLRSWIIVAASGIFSVFGMSSLYFTSMIQTSAAVAAILLYTSPIFVMVMSLIFFKERLTAKKIVAFLFAIVGCALVSGIMSGAKASPAGIAIGLAGGFAYSLYGILTTFFLKENKDPLVFTALSFLFASATALLTSNPGVIVRFIPTAPSPALLILICVLLSLCTAVIPFLLYTVGLKGVKPDAASILAFSDPLAACLFGTVILGQPMDSFGVIGIACMLAAIVVLNLPHRKASASPK